VLAQTTYEISLFSYSGNYLFPAKKLHGGRRKINNGEETTVMVAGDAFVSWRYLEVFRSMDG
jgi:hypothetical protein